MADVERIYWKNAVKADKQEKFKQDLLKQSRAKDCSFGHTTEIALALTMSSGKVIEIYIPNEDF